MMRLSQPLYGSKMSPGASNINQGCLTASTGTMASFELLHTMKVCISICKCAALSSKLWRGRNLLTRDKRSLPQTIVLTLI